MCENTLQSPAEFLRLRDRSEELLQHLGSQCKKNNVLKKKKIVVICAHLYHLERRGQFVLHSQAFLHFVYLLLSCPQYAAPLRELLKSLSLLLQKNDCISFKSDLGLSNVIHLGVFPCFFFLPYQKFIGQTGTVHRITDRGDVRVQFNSETRWTFHPGALTKVCTDRWAWPQLGMLQGAAGGWACCGRMQGVSSKCWRNILLL